MADRVREEEEKQSRMESEGAMTKQKDRDILSLYPDELKKVFAERGEKSYRASQVFSWLHAKGASSYGEMTDLPKDLRRRLEEEYPLRLPRIVRELLSAQDGTRKYLFALHDGNVVESVRMPYEHGISVCVSTQVGCRMGCRFCASTIGGLVRSLTASEMLGQVYGIRKRNEGRISHVVLMGSGEPLDNYEEAVRFIRLLNAREGADISQRNITLSTCGLVPEIQRLAGEKLAVTLAVSLHAPADEKRRRLMPVAARYPLSLLMPACREYAERTGRRVTFEYALVKGGNDSASDAAQLAALLKGMRAHVNLIPVNPVRERDLHRPSAAQIMKFQKELENYGINVTIRREMGSDISGACGQLRKSYIETDQENRE